MKNRQSGWKWKQTAKKNHSSVTEGPAGVSFSFTQDILRQKDSTDKHCCKAGELKMLEKKNVHQFRVSSEKDGSESLPKTLTTCTKECRALTFINWIRNRAMSHKKANISKHFCSNAKPSIYNSAFIWQVSNISVHFSPQGLHLCYFICWVEFLLGN